MATSPNSAGGQQQQTPAMFRIYDGEYFEIVKRGENDILLVRCHTCGPEALPLRSSAKSNGNILKHIKRRHPELLDRIREEKNIKARGSPGISNGNSTLNHKSPVSFNASRKQKSANSGAAMGMYIVKDDPVVTNSHHVAFTAAHAAQVKSEYAAHITVHVQSPCDVRAQEEALLQQQQHEHQQEQTLACADQCENIEYLTGFPQMTSTTGPADMIHEYKPVITAVASQSLTTQPPIKRARANSAIVEDLQILSDNSQAAAPSTLPQVEGLGDEDDDDDAEGDDPDNEEEDAEEEGIDDNLMIVHNPHGATNSANAGAGTFAASEKNPPPLQQQLADTEEIDTEQYFDTTISPSVSRRYASKMPGTPVLDDHRELLELRKQLMMREFELVQQQHRAQMERQRRRHQLEMELLQREMSHKRTEHDTTMRILNQQLREK